MYLDWVAGILELLGKWVTGNKNRWGHAINFACCVMWVVYVFTSDSTYGLLFVVVPAMAINVRNFIKWTREANRKRNSDMCQKETDMDKKVGVPNELAQRMAAEPMLDGLFERAMDIAREVGVEEIGLLDDQIMISGDQEQVDEFCSRMKELFEVAMGHNCTKCDFLRSKQKFDDVRYFCRHRGSILDPRKKWCEHWELAGEDYSPESTYADYVEGDANKLTLPSDEHKCECGNAACIVGEDGCDNEDCPGRKETP